MNTQQARGRWISVTPDSYVASDDAIDIRILTSPYDIPDGVRGGYDDDPDRFVVEFRYMLDEEYRIVDIGDGVRIRLGKHSSRIVGVEADVAQPSAFQVAVPTEDPGAHAYAAIKKAIQNVEETIDARTRRIGRRSRSRRVHRGGRHKRQNYIVAQRVLEEKQDAIFSVMQHAVAS